MVSCGMSAGNHLEGSKGEAMTNEEASIQNHLKLEHTYLKLPKHFYTLQEPSKVPRPQWVLFNESLAKTLGLDGGFLQSEEGLQILAGNQPVPNTLAEAYAGHQFGYFTRLGDGRALLLGEWVAPNGERYDLQLKGSGRTPYSRGGDGKATLGPMLREYIISEGMEGLGIPTTRSLAVVTTGEWIQREEALPGAILTRLAKSHLRVGTFQYAAKWGSLEDLRALADYTLLRHFTVEEENPYLALLKQVAERQAALIAQWQLVGFIHGVMNTDNMSISGETIDYGPCAFMDSYNPQTVFSSIDEQGRYAYGNQPLIGGWNLARFAETLLPLIAPSKGKAVELAQAVISQFSVLYKAHYQEGMRRKLGLFEEKEGDEDLIAELLKLMEKYKADYTYTFVALTLGDRTQGNIFEKEDFKKWENKWQSRQREQKESPESIQKLMQQSNPRVIPRNHKVEAALEAAVNEGDKHLLRQLIETLQSPYDYSKDLEDSKELPPPTSCGYKTYCGT